MRVAKLYRRIVVDASSSWDHDPAFSASSCSSSSNASDSSSHTNSNASTSAATPSTSSSSSIEFPVPVELPAKKLRRQPNTSEVPDTCFFFGTF